MNDRYINREKYFMEQNYTTEMYVIPYINKLFPITSNMIIAEIGCGEGGNLKPFLDLNCKVVGIDISENKISNARKLLSSHPGNSNLMLITKDIYQINPIVLPLFDIIIMRDTLEHIHDQGAFLKHLSKFIKPSGKIFFAFPPWRMPFGGHQQICNSSFLSRLPYFHLLPNVLYVGILKLFGEGKDKINTLLEVKETKISIIGFKKMLANGSFKIDSELFYMVNPNYEIKFNLKARKLPIILNIPFIREFFITTYYCLASIETGKSIKK